MNLLLSGFCESLEATEMMWIVNLHHHSRWASWQNKEVWPLSFFPGAGEWGGKESWEWAHGLRQQQNSHYERDIGERHRAPWDRLLSENYFWTTIWNFSAVPSLQSEYWVHTSESNQDHSEVVQVKQRWNQEREDHYYICFLLYCWFQLWKENIELLLASVISIAIGC